jgi:hypothetical protein
VFPLLVGLILNVEKLTLMQFVLVYHHTLECLPAADQNVSQVLNVLKTKHVSKKNALTHVQELVV